MEGNKAVDQLNRLEGKLLDVEAQVKVQEQRVRDFTTRHGVVNVESTANEQVAVVAQLRSSLIMKDMEIANFLKYSQTEDPLIVRLKNERESLENKIKEIESGKNNQLPGQTELPTLAIEYSGIQRDLMVQVELLKILTQQYELSKLNSAGRDKVFQILELAEVPEEKSGPNRAFLCIIITMIGFLLSVVIIVFKKRLNLQRSQTNQNMP